MNNFLDNLLSGAGTVVTTPAPAKPQGDALADFYRNGLPPKGHYALFQVGTKRHTWCISIDELEHETDKLIAEGNTDIYFATASFTEPGSRTQANVSGKQCFYQDLDAGEKKLTKHGPNAVYQSQKDALNGVWGFVAKTGLTPSMVVSSGEGLHVYWVLDTAVDGATWTPVAKQFQKFSVAHGLKVDSAVTADSARILRPIGTKHPNGKTVSVLEASGRVYSLAEFANAIKLPTFDTATGGADWALGADFEGVTLEVNDDLHLSNNHPKTLARIVTECEAVRYGAANQDSISEPYWRALIGIAKHTVDGRKNAHMVSCRHLDYDEAETDRKFDAWATGPTTCATFAEFNPKACASCKHKAPGKFEFKSPITLGQEPGTVGMVLLPSGTKRPTRKLLKTTLTDWKQTADGEKTVPLNTTENLSALIDLVGVKVRYNVMTRKTVITIPELKTERDDYDTAALARLGDIAIRAGMAREGLKELADAVAGTNPFHPARQWIEATPWDGVPRAKQLHDSFELMDPTHAPLRAALVDAWMLQGIGAVFETEGIAAQGILVLNGEQDVHKTRKVENLCPLSGAVRTGIHLDPLDKDSVFQATSAWITELGEIDSTFRKADVSALKAFTTRSEDVLRRPYAKVDNTYRRRTIFAGTVNGTGFLADATGDRRFWTLHVKSCHLLAGDDMQRIWAEYLVRYRAGERWHLHAETKAALNLSNADHRVVDPLRERIQTAFDWGSVEAENWHTRPNTLWLTATDVCMRIGVSHPSKTDSTRAGAIVSALNNRVSRKSNGAKLLALPGITGGRP